MLETCRLDKSDKLGIAPNNSSVGPDCAIASYLGGPVKIRQRPHKTMDKDFLILISVCSIPEERNEDIHTYICTNQIK